MIDRLAAFMHRPLRDTDRPRLFALAVVVLLGAAAVLALIDRPTERPATAPPRAPVPTPEARLTDQPAPAAVSEPPSEEGKPPAAMDATREQVAAAERAGRRFLTGYLPYSYGRRTAKQIPAVSERLRARLQRDRPRVPPDVRKRRPEVVLLHAHGVASRSGELVALVSDGAHSYSVRLELKRGPAGWQVIDVGS